MAPIAISCYRCFITLIYFAPLLAGVIDRDARDDKGREQDQCNGVVSPTFHKEAPFRGFDAIRSPTLFKGCRLNVHECAASMRAICVTARYK